MSANRLLLARAARHAAAVLFLCAVAPPPACAQMPSGIGVRIYDGVRVPVAAMAAAKRVVEDIFADADVAVRWRQCDGTPGRCNDVVSAEGVVIRLIAAPPAPNQDLRRLPLGQSTLARPSEPSTFASVYPDRVRNLSDRAGVPFGEPLGYAIAHEVAHLLLRSGVHTAQGLMREHWTPAEVRQQRKPDWRLLVHERLLVSAAAHERLAMRAARSHR